MNIRFSLLPTSLLLLIALLSGSCSPKNRREKGGKKVVHLYFRDDVKSADPAHFSDVVSAEFSAHIFEGLLGFSYLGRPDQLQPVLAQNLPEKKDKGRTLIFRLKKGIHFADDPAFPNGLGRAVTAQDFIYSFKRISDPHTDGVNWWAFDGVIEGLNSWRENLSQATSPEEKKIAFDKAVPGLQSPDAHTLIIKLTKVYPPMLYILAMVHSSVVAREAVEKYGPEIQNHPVGTGPFKLREWVRGSKMILEKNPKYRDDFYPNVGSEEARQAGLLKAAATKVPFVDEIHYDIIKEEQPRWLKFRAGELDNCVIPSDSFSESIGADGQLKAELKDKGIQLRKSLIQTTWWIEFNHKDALLGSKLKLRQALALAFNRGRSLEILHNNRGLLANGPYPPNLEAGSELPSYPYEHNLARAKALLAEAGFPDGKNLPELSFDLRGPGSTNRQLGELIQDDFSKIGVKVKIIANSYPEAIEKQRKSRFQMMLGGWAGDYPDPENFLQNFYGPNAAPGPNSSNYSNKEFDRLYVQIRSQYPSPERRGTLRKMVEILNRDAVVALWYNDVEYIVLQPWLKNFAQNPLYYGKGKFLDINLKD